jgi:uncharacterized protein YkwD
MVLPPIRNALLKGLTISFLCGMIGGPILAATATDDFDYDIVVRDDSKMSENILMEHNKERTRQGQSALQWDDTLAKDASAYAKILADTDRFEHSNPSKSGNAQGENLWMGSKRAYDWDDMVGMWLMERQNTKSGIFPAVSKTGDWSDVGHYTQIIWPETQKLGCGFAGNSKDEYLVCRYLPAGNVMGRHIKVNLGN